VERRLGGDSGEGVGSKERRRQVFKV